ncbi:chitinase [Streptomyces sp. NPDC098789]|uniref:chitinase n=1 Tax=Streptomyces sp. NPDC098789 TaxID=3366098 RepID=UPI003802B390
MQIWKSRRARIAIGATVIGVVGTSVPLLAHAGADRPIEASLRTEKGSVWYSGGEFTLRNASGTADSNWRLEFDVPEGTFANYGEWATKTTRKGTRVVIEPKAGQSIAPGSTLTIGYGVQGDGNKPLSVTGCSLDGAEVKGCAGGGHEEGGEEEGGEEGGAPDEQAPSTPQQVTGKAVDSTSAQLKWNASTDNVGVTGYDVYQGKDKIASVDGKTLEHIASGLKPQTPYTFTVRAKDRAGNTSPDSAPVTVTTEKAPAPSEKKRWLTGYWQNFDNGAARQKLSDVPSQYNLIAVSFAEAAPENGSIGFKLDLAGTGYSSVEEFKKDMAALRAAGRKVVVSIGGEKGNVLVTDAASATRLADSTYRLMQEYGFDGIDVDIEHGSLNATHMADAMRKLRQKAGDGLVITAAPETLFMLPSGVKEERSYLNFALKIKDILTIVNTQYYNSGSMNGCDGKVYEQGTVDFVASQACAVIKAGLPAEKVGLGLPATQRAAGGGHMDPAKVNDALTCLTDGKGCGTFKPAQTWPSLGGAMSWSTNWDATNGNRFAELVGGHLGTGKR